MTRHFTNWLAAGCVAATIAIHQPAVAQDSADKPRRQSVSSASRSIENRLQQLGSFQKSTLTSQLVGVRVSILSVDAQVANEVFFSSEKDFTTLAHRLAPNMTLNVEERQQAFSWNRVVRTELIPRLLEEVERRQTGAAPAIIAESHVVGLLGRESSQRMAIPLSGSLLAAGTDDPEFFGLKLIRMTPSLPSSDRVRLETVFTLQQNHNDPEVAPKYIVKSTRTLLHEDQSLAALLRKSDDDNQGLLVLLTPGQAQPVSPQPKQTSPTTSTDSPSPADAADAAGGEKETVAKDTTIPGTSLPENQAQLLKEIRGLRSLIQDVRGDVSRLRSALRLLDANTSSAGEEPRGIQKETETIRFPAHTSRLLNRQRRVSRIALADPKTLDVIQYSPQEIGLIGLRPGTTTVTVWFDDDSKPLILSVHVTPNDASNRGTTTRDNNDPTRAEIEQALDQLVEINALDTPLREVIQHLSQQANVNVVIDEQAIQEEGFVVEHPVSLAFKGVTLRSALKLLLSELSCTWVIEDEVLKITSKARAEGELVVLAYRAPELPGDDAGREQRLTQLSELIQVTVAPDSWSDHGGQGSIGTFPGGNSLVIRQTQNIHAEIRVLLQSLAQLLGPQSPSSNTSMLQQLQRYRVAQLLQREQADRTRLPVRIVDELNTISPVAGPQQPVVVVQNPPMNSNRDPFQGLSFLRPGSPARVVDDGNPATSAVRQLPPVGVSNGRYIDLRQPTVAMVVRHYTPSRNLLMSFHEEGDSDADLARKLVEHIRSSINPDSWKDQDVQAEVIVSGRVYFYIRHTPHTHDRIRRLLGRMEADVKDDEGSSTEQAATADPDGSTDLWKTLGLKVQSISADELGTAQGNYRGGLRITEVRSLSPASLAGLQQGDVLVGLDKWETVSLKNLDYVLKQIADGRVQPGLKFFVIRDGETLYGQLLVVPQPE